MTLLFAEKVATVRASDTISSEYRRLSDLAELMPVRHVRINDRILTVDSGDISIRRNVSRWANTDVKSFNWPLKTLKMDVIGRLVNVGYLATVYTDKSETDTSDVDIMDIRLYENVVNVKIKVSKRWRGYDWSRKTRGRKRTRIDNSTKKLLRSSKINVNETLTVWNTHRRNRKARIRDEPEKKRNKHFKISVRFLVRLVTI